MGIFKSFNSFLKTSTIHNLFNFFYKKEPETDDEIDEDTKKDQGFIFLFFSKFIFVIIFVRN